MTSNIAINDQAFDALYDVFHLNPPSQEAVVPSLESISHPWSEVSPEWPPTPIAAPAIDSEISSSSLAPAPGISNASSNHLSPTPKKIAPVSTSRADKRSSSAIPDFVCVSDESKEALGNALIEIRESIQVEPIGISMQEKKKELWLRYRITSSLFGHFIDTRHMKTYSIAKFGYAGSWALARSAVWSMSQFKTLPNNFHMPKVPGMSREEMRKELLHYVKLRQSGQYPNRLEPIPSLNPIKKKKKETNRGRRRKTDTGGDIIEKTWIYERDGLDNICKSHPMTNGNNGYDLPYPTVVAPPDEASQVMPSHKEVFL